MRRRRTSLAFTCAVLLVSSQLAALAHRAYVEHLRCAEHGKLIHGSGFDRGSIHESTGWRDRHQVAFDSRPAAEAGHEHDHCQLGTPTRATPPRAAVIAVAARAPTPRAALPDGRCVPRRSLWRSAPKTSPPA